MDVLAKFSPMTRKTTAGGREIWLDGLRGIAAVIVAWFHFTETEMPIPHRSFWDEPVEENRRWIQLPPFRLLFAGDAMVSLFFVISGYSISLAIVRFRDQGDNDNFYRKLTSSVLRRGLRLYIPILIIGVISHSLCYIGAYRGWQFGPSEGCPEAEPWSAIWPHFKCFMMTFFTALDLSGPYHSFGLNAQLWTIPLEFQGSMSVYLAILGLVSVRSNVRLIIIAFLSLVLLWFGFDVQFAFLSGLMLAELDAWKRDNPQPLEMARKRPSSTQGYYIGLARAVLFVSSIYLICLPFQDHLTADFWFQSQLNLPFWENIIVRIRCWHAIGAVIIVGTLKSLPSMRAPLETALVQYLAKISFSMYLLQLTIFRIFRDPILHSVTQFLWGENFHQTRQDENAFKVVVLAWVVATAILGPMLVLSSNYLAILVDKKSIGWAYQFEKLIATH